MLVKKYENLLKGANKNIVNIVGKQGKIIKRFKDEGEFFDHVGLSQSINNFKISLYKSLSKFPLLKNSTLTSSYFKSNFKLIMKVYKTNVNIFSEKKVKTLVSLIFICFILACIVLENFIQWLDFYSVWRILPTA